MVFGLFGKKTRVNTNVDVVAQNEIFFSPTTEISVNTDSFASAVNSVGYFLDQTLSDGVTVLESALDGIDGIGSGIGNGISGAGVNVGFGLMAGVSIGALVWVLK